MGTSSLLEGRATAATFAGAKLKGGGGGLALTARPA